MYRKHNNLHPGHEKEVGKDKLGIPKEQKRLELIFQPEEPQPLKLTRVDIKKEGIFHNIPAEKIPSFVLKEKLIRYGYKVIVLLICFAAAAYFDTPNLIFKLVQIINGA